jgi:hypothetical protein
VIGTKADKTKLRVVALTIALASALDRPNDCFKPVTSEYVKHRTGSAALLVSPCYRGCQWCAEPLGALFKVHIMTLDGRWKRRLGVRCNGRLKDYMKQGEPVGKSLANNTLTVHGSIRAGSTNEKVERSGEKSRE